MALLEKGVDRLPVRHWTCTLDTLKSAFPTGVAVGSTITRFDELSETVVAKYEWNGTKWCERLEDSIAGYDTTNDMYKVCSMQKNSVIVL